MDTIDAAEIYDIVRDALVLLTLVTSIVLFFVALCLARRRNDPARLCFTFMKIGWATYCMYVKLRERICVNDNLPPQYLIYS